MSNLPEELIYEILFRSPLDSLARCKCLSKGWGRMIKDQNFVKLHLKQSVVRKDKQVLFLTRNGYYIFDLHSTNEPSMLKFPFENLRVRNEIGYCNGLLCFYANNESIILWNPYTREYQTLLPFPRRMEQIAWGFGFHEKTNEYKVIRISRPFFRPKLDDWKPKHLRSEVKVYTLGSKSWRVLNEIPYRVILFSPPALVEGILHWNADVIDTGVHVIVSFNIEDENFREIPLPPVRVSQYPKSRDRLGAYKGNLSVMASVDYVDHELWVMLQYGVKESWTKLIKINGLELGQEIYEVWVMAVQENGDIVVRIKYNECFVYSHECNSLRRLPIGLIRNLVSSSKYVESLVSPKQIENPIEEDNDRHKTD